MLMIKRAIYWLTLQGHWNVATEGNTFVWRRYDFDTDTWETKAMSAEEVAEAHWMWAIR